MGMSVEDKRTERRKDTVSIAMLCVLLFAAMYVLLGFGKYGLSTPYFYTGGDEFQPYTNNKMVLDSGWIWFNDDIGAPYGSAYIGWVQWGLMNADLLVLKIIGAFVKNDAIAATNLQFLLVFPFCALTSFMVLRALDVKRKIALFGAFLFSCSPYIFARSVMHLCLTTCYFIPFSILLCVWASEPGDGRYLKFRKGFFKYKKNWAAVVLTLLIANNGVGYYPIFTCVLLGICALRNLLSQRKWAAIVKPVVTAALITFFFFLAAMPYFVYVAVHGGGRAAIRNYSGEIEGVGLKLVQMFIPINDHGIGLLRRFIDRYNLSMPMVNENYTAYLGIGGGIGFLLSLTGVFIARKQEESGGDRFHLYSVLNIGAFIYATIGGLGSVVATFTGFYMIRSLNRMSIYIMFISICTLCFVLGRCEAFLKERGKKKQLLWHVGLIFFVLLCAYDLLPTYGQRDAMMEAGKEAYLSDEEFIGEIEELLEDGDMVYQLPYHVYPESGPVNDMLDYHLFVGYLHSDSLKWSYGGVRGGESDRWNEKVDCLPTMSMRISAVLRAGFKGIYIDTRAYTSEELVQLKTSIEDVIGISPIVSRNGMLLFYNLYPYLEANPDVLEGVLANYTLGETRYFDGSEWDAHLYFSDGVYDTENGFAWTEGDQGEFSVVFDEEITEDLVMELNICNVFIPPQQLTVTCDGKTLFDEMVQSAEETIIIPIPAECVSQQELDMSFSFPDSTSPAEQGESTDGRDIAFALQSFSIELD